MKTAANCKRVEACRLLSAALGVLSFLGFPGMETHLHAQQLFEVIPDAKVKVTAPGMGLNETVGVVHQVTPDGLVVEFDSATGPVSVPADRIADVRIARGTRGHPFIGLVLGAAAGGALGAAFINHRPAKVKPECRYASSPHGFFYSGWRCSDKTVPASSSNQAALGASLGALAGFFIGFRFRTDVWHRADMNGPGLSVQPVIDPERQGFVLSLSF